MDEETSFATKQLQHELSAAVEIVEQLATLSGGARARVLLWLVAVYVPTMVDPEHVVATLADMARQA